CVGLYAPEPGEGGDGAVGEVCREVAGGGLQCLADDAHRGAVVGGAEGDGLAEVFVELVEDVSAEADFGRGSWRATGDDDIVHGTLDGLDAGDADGLAVDGRVGAGDAREGFDV